MSAVTATTTRAISAPILGAGPLRASWVFVGRSVRHSIRDVDAMLMAILLPVLMMLLFTYVFGGAIAGDQRAYIAYVTPGIILLCAGFGASSTAVSVSRDMTTGTINRFRTMPIPSATVLVGHVVASLLRNLAATAVVVVVGMALGYRSGAGIGGWLMAVALIALWILAITSLFALIGLVSRSPESAGMFGFVFLFLPYVSSAFVPVDTMPSWMQSFANHQPITPLIESIRNLLTGLAPGPELAWALGWTLAIIAVSGTLIAVIFPRQIAR